ncbi:ATP-binding cassette domain-containing protein [Pseudonocardia sp. HH130630-07]|uniref:ATP-binding cassette domain-containing protein n=1 Tax=Pseudonocardia sp. HH130630-07 TaxID=1690815 RepID=UPI000814E8E5|nr:ABC transporter ATP-binding protein [Pseudonocardia sp. HH130630-07]ANY09315.1 peptide ABC transporter ATP-binding protein [Pseudonocardia sp. HH130630-07]
MTAPLLQVQDVGHRYGRGSSAVRVLRGVSATVEAGRTLGVVGESGSGKTTLARIVMGLETPAEGTVRFGGTALEPRSHRALRGRVQMVFQDPHQSLDPRFRIGRSIAEPLRALRRPRAEIRERVRAILVRVGLGADDARRHPHEFSGGQRQRIAIARALVTNPELVILDEPTSALDVSVQAQILNLLLDLQEEYRVGYLFISHDLAVVRHVSHEVAVLVGGVVVEHGDADAILRRPAHEYTQRLIASSPFLPETTSRPQEDTP